jgi:hypothetical protein
MSVWKSRRTQQFLTLEEWERQNDTSRCEGDATQYIYRYCVNYNVILEFFTFTKDSSDHSSLVTPSFKVPLADILPIGVDEEVHVKEIILLRLHDARSGLKSQTTSKPNREDESNQRPVHWLYNEFLLLKHLKANSKIWREGVRIQYRFKDSYTKTHPLGGLSKLILMGTKDSISGLCKTLNVVNEPRRKIKSQIVQREEELKGDNADYYLALPYNLFKGPFEKTKEWLQQEFAELLLLDSEFQSLVSGESKHVHHVHLEWTTYGSRYPWCEHPQISTNRNWIQTFTEDNPEVPVPFWIQDNLSDNPEGDNKVDSKYAVLVTVAIYPNEIVFSIPAGKRELHETSLECLLRETYEETLLTLTPFQRHLIPSVSDSEGIYSASIGERGVEEALPLTCQELYHFRPNKGTDTFVFYYGDPRPAVAPLVQVDDPL